MRNTELKLKIVFRPQIPGLACYTRRIDGSFVNEDGRKVITFVRTHESTILGLKTYCVFGAYERLEGERTYRELNTDCAELRDFIREHLDMSAYIAHEPDGDNTIELYIPATLPEFVWTREGARHTAEIIELFPDEQNFPLSGS